MGPWYDTAQLHHLPSADQRHATSWHAPMPPPTFRSEGWLTLVNLLVLALFLV